jgi:hypothetical protein
VLTTFRLLVAVVLSLLAVPVTNLHASSAGSVARLRVVRSTTQTVKCPTVLVPGRNAAQKVLTTAQHAVPRMYGNLGAAYLDFHIEFVAALSKEAAPLIERPDVRAFVAASCGHADAGRYWTAFVYLPKLGNDPSLNQFWLYLANVKGQGWKVVFDNPHFQP